MNRLTLVAAATLIGLLALPAQAQTPSGLDRSGFDPRILAWLS